ncbi:MULTISPECIES: PTS sugar transporter subunit IIA [Desulfococcus]|jgi:PTS system mannose-specific IIA component|uniref:PTS system fructose subfamily IIA component n=1 Tax=Desulfococcus multivorans DSM 2059 TaxID=1121405 RepID=S7TPN6_DESML|nr:PTS sugar transporter subunit IIA [Desulfococcus multivorans]AOY57811.1 fructose-specific phosphotransferase enzyme IIA component [Desulfococcus multivorans]AQV00196.1 PTS fructose transporter subunit IIA [Desulfococcus multivorans]EPR38896.1 PTS system fructose subfamily IIA component [Desulfococcus multivorans DSM 2059]SJZ67773.1 PTS system, mannose-specific IIA component [Desulfococcus multivorans DSM 2059]
MIGIVIVTHGQLGSVLIDTAELIVGFRPEAMIAVSINITEDVDKLRGKVARAVKEVTRKHGALILTDMFGGTPSNISYSFLREGHVDVVSGVNLPIVIKAINSRENMDLGELAECLENFGKRSISMASGILRGNKRG